MRKILLSLLLVALLAIFAAMVISGFSVGRLTIGHSIQEIIEENNKLDTAIATLGTKIDTEYQTSKINLDASFKKLQTEKQTYQDTIAYSTPEDLMAANQTEEYKLDYLWTNIGLFATRNNLVMKVDLSHGSSGVSNQYNISFTAIGEYLSISEFIYAIEKDPSLGFRIEEFAIVPYSEDSLQATFIIKNVAIDKNSLSETTSVSSGTVTSNNNTNTNINVDSNTNLDSNSNINSNTTES